MGYIAVRPMKVQTASGEIVIRQKGDEVPEAATWANPAVWIKRGYIQVTDGQTATDSGYAREKLIPARESTEADIKRAVSHVPQPGKPLPEATQEAPPSDAELELLELSRADLDALAVEHGVAEPAKMPNKKAVAEAILAKQAG